MSDENKVQRPNSLEMYGGSGLRRNVYLKDEVDAYIAALERRARIAERVISKVFEPNDDRMKELIADAEFEIDAEIAQEGR